MCIQDIKLARGASADAPAGNVIAAGVGQLLKANPERYAVSVAIVVAAPGVDAVSVLVYARVGGKEWPLASLSGYDQSRVLSLVQVGQAITGEIWWSSGGATLPAAIYAAESAFDQRLEEVIR